MKKVLLLIVFVFILVGCSEKPLLTCTIKLNSAGIDIYMKNEFYRYRIVTTTTYNVNSKEKADELVKLMKNQIPNAKDSYKDGVLTITYENKGENEIDIDMHKQAALADGYTCN